MPKPVTPIPELRRTGLAGKLTISRPSSFGGDDYISITVQDELSGSEIVEVRVGMAEFTRALTAFANQPCTVDIGAPEFAGSVRQHKMEAVRVRTRYGNTPEERKAVEDEALLPFEVDGWTARRSDLSNSHRIVQWGHNGDPGFNTYSVTFTRSVRPEEGETIESLIDQNRILNEPKTESKPTPVPAKKGRKKSV